MKLIMRCSAPNSGQLSFLRLARAVQSHCSHLTGLRFARNGRYRSADTKQQLPNGTTQGEGGDMPQNDKVNANIIVSCG